MSTNETTVQTYWYCGGVGDNLMGSD